MNGNIVYRVDGLLADRQDLSQFQSINYVPAPTVTTTEKTVTTYRAPDGPPDVITNTTTITKETTVEP